MRSLLIGASAATAALALAAPAWAQDPPKPSPGDSAVSQYVEEVPSAWGEAAPSVPPKAQARQRSQPLPAAIQTRVRATGGTDAAALERNATTPSLGAPVRRTHATVRRIIRPHDDAPSAGGAFSAAVTAVGSGGGGLRFVVLGLGLLAITAATGYGAVRRSRGIV